MQSYFYTFSLNNPLLSDVDLEATSFFSTCTRRPQRISTKASNTTLISPLANPRKGVNRLSLLTRSTLSDDEPLTPKSTFNISPTISSYDQHTLAIDKNGIRNTTKGRNTIDGHTKKDENGKSHTLIWDDPSGDSVRTHITRITRTMQAFHVRELFWDQVNTKEAKKRKRQRTVIAPDQHVATHSSGWSTLITDNAHLAQQQHHHHHYHHHYHLSMKNTLQLDLAEQQQQQDGNSASLMKPTCITLSPSSFATIQQLWNPLNSISDTSAMNNGTIKDNDDDEDDDDNDTIWHENFMTLMASLIQQSEHLEYLSTEILDAENHVRSLLSLASTVQEQFYEREKHYQERLKEFDAAGQRQSIMLDTLDQLVTDMDAKSTQSSTSLVKSASFVHKARWNVGMLFGSDVGTGDIIYSAKKGFEMIVSGSGIIVDDNDSAAITRSNQNCIYTTTKLSSQHTTMTLYRYQLHLTTQDRIKLFVLLPKHQWIPDLFVDQCQHNEDSPLSKQCTTQFNLFQRKHHCRRHVNRIELHNYL
ncbi:hypothetical protein BC941DRAFT_435223 [Chlamydoabsidia padenii]|nr:hypothetical protein BC941DRAFT_435223 [Chlamydoabsidia padenii]